MSAAAKFACKRFSGKLAIVTGSTAGIGFACARRLLEEGAHLIVNSPKQKDVDNALEELRGFPHVSGIPYDAEKPEDRKRLIDFALKVGNGVGIDMLVSNVGILIRSNILQTTEKDWDHIMNINLKSHFLLIKDVLPFMKSRGGGNIVMIGSLVAYDISDRLTQYGAYPISKAAMLNLVKQLAWSCGVDNIRVNGVAPSAIESKERKLNEETMEYIRNKTALKRMCKPEEIASVVAFLCSSDAAYITGEIIKVGGGWSHGL